MITLRNLSLARGGKLLIEGAACQIHAGQKVGVVGANGCGKSSLFALILGELHAEAGELELPPGWVVAHVAQETPADARTAIDHVLDGDAELRRVESEVAAAEHTHDGEAIGLAHERLHQIGGYGARARASALLHGLGFADRDAGRPVSSFSGGWRVRLNLARALMCRSDLLLLDEPTNHLDLDAVIWLEQWLKGYRGTLLLISHDRDFLDAVVGTVAHIEARMLRLYAGNYSAFESARAQQLATQRAMFEKQQREIAKLHRFIDRFRAKATKARQAQSRIKALARLEDVAPAHVDSPFEFCFEEPLASPDPLILLEDVALGYGEAPVLEGLRLTLRPGERIGLLGRNGAGKSTLIKCLAGELEPLRGQRLDGRGLAVGYFAQHQLEQLRPDESPLQHLMRAEPATREQDLRDFLGGFDFRNDMALAPVGRFSGGEKSRLALALLIRRRPNLLLLDEPTNHLDLEMRHALTVALSEYEGAVVLVSHDRHLLRSAVDRFLLVANGQALPFDGDLDDYRAWLESVDTSGRDDDGGGAATAPSRKQQRREEAEAKDRRAAQIRPLRRELGAVEKDLESLGSEKAVLDTRLADPAAYAGSDRVALQENLKRQAELARLIEAAEERWLELQQRIEEFEAP
ncbi:MAG TPA: ATP-binding cassette domain-containing protein [Rhodocyclaceae bacterium]|nr:ATP-binding cassette domain-containing protein [Rhodocyclaceae bacterium]